MSSEIFELSFSICDKGDLLVVRFPGTSTLVGVYISIKCLEWVYKAVSVNWYRVNIGGYILKTAEPTSLLEIFSINEIKHVLFSESDPVRGVATFFGVLEIELGVWSPENNRGVGIFNDVEVALQLGGVIILNQTISYESISKKLMHQHQIKWTNMYSIYEQILLQILFFMILNFRSDQKTSMHIMLLRNLFTFFFFIHLFF